ncbi:MAG: hypothetical protein KY464_14595, partial [Gemmatimonadetes bacterium]|nr:hypothetical protein [Gemmatimonadota bacterium]
MSARTTAQSPPQLGRHPRAFAAPLFGELGEALGPGGELILVPGNHDHGLVAGWIDGRLQTEPSGFLGRVKARLEARRRERAASGARTPKLFLALVASLLVLLTLFATSLTYLYSDPDGREVTLDEVAALTAAGRVEKATFLDEDSTVVLELRSAQEAATRRATPPAGGAP